ncbi:MAG: hypothetical protein ACOCWC_00680 [Bacteroidota bacterium]
MSYSASRSIPTILKRNYLSVLIDIMAISFVYFVPAISHLLNFPLYLIEPMRIMVIIAIVHTNRTNALILAATLPLFSYLISGHPLIIKSGFIAIELIINVVLFYALIKKLQPFIALFSSILISKLLYYGMKYLSLVFLFPDDKLISTPLYIQLIMALVLSAYLFVMFYFKKR